MKNKLLITQITIATFFLASCGGSHGKFGEMNLPYLEKGEFLQDKDNAIVFTSTEPSSPLEAAAKIESSLSKNEWAPVSGPDDLGSFEKDMFLNGTSEMGGTQLANHMKNLNDEIQAYYKKADEIMRVSVRTDAGGMRIGMNIVNK